MKFEGIIKHGVAIDAEESNSVNCEIIHCEGITLRLVDINSDNISIAFGPIGPFVNMDNYYTKTEIDNKGYLTQHLDISQLATKLLLEDYQPKGEYLVLSDIEGKANIDDVYTKEYIDDTKLDISHIKFRLKALPSYASNVYTIENIIFSVIGYNIDATILEDALSRSSSKGGWVDVAIQPSSFKKLDNLISAINAEIGDNGFQYKSPIPSTTNSVYSGINSSLIDNGSNINKIVENLEDYIIANATKVTNLVDLTDVFSTGIANDINLAIASNRNKVIYVSPGDYEVNGSINFHGAELVFCFGNIIGPEDPSVLENKYYSADAGDGKSPIIRYVVSTNGNGNKLYIKKITVRGNYCGFYVFFETNADIKIGEIIGLYGVIDGVDYSAKTEEWVSYVNKAPAFNAKKKTRQAVLPDSWVINAGFMFEHIENSTINIGGISNLNYGFYSIRNYISLFDQVLRECVFNINSIVCKKAVVLDNANILSLQNGEIVKNYRTNDYSYFAVVNDRDIEGNVFNIGGLDYVEAPNTNSVEIMNEDYYDQTKDNRRIVFWLLDRYRTRDGIPEREINDNKFTGAYLQGVYDVMIDAVNIGATIWDLHFQLVDLYYNDGTLCSGRTNAYNHLHKISYYKGNPSDSQELYLAIQVFDADPIFVLDNCYTMYIHNYGDAFIRPADIDVKSNCRDIRFNLVYDDNFLSGWQIIDRVNYAYMKDYIYDRGNIYKRSWNDGYTNSSNEGVNYYTRSEIDNKGYLTQHQSLSNYYTKTEVDTVLGEKANSADLASVATSGSYNDLNNKPTIPTVPSNVSAFNNDAGYLTTESDPTVPNHVKGITQQNITNWNNKADSSDLADYYTKSEVNSALDDKQDTITDLATIRSGAALGATAYQKPNGGIPKSDLASSVQTSLGLADSALQQHQDLSSLADGAEYDSSEKKIYLKHGNTRLGNPIDATAFIKDGMIDTVSVTNGNLVISFNTDAGKQPISLPISDIFNANNYYTKTEIDNKGYLTSETDPVFGASVAADIKSTDITNWNAKQSAIADLDDIRTGASLGATALQSYTETDPTVPSWAKNPNKPTYTASEVGALPSTTQIPSKTSDLTNDSGFITGYTETDPVFTASVAHGITSSDIANWNSKTSNVGTITGITMNGASKGTSGVVDLGTVITEHQDISGKVDKETGKGLSSNDYTDAEKTKLSGIAAGAEVNVQSDWNQTTTTADDYIKNKPSLATVATSGSYSDLSNKPTIPTVNNATLTIQKNGTTVGTFTANASSNVTANISVPTKVSDLTNDSGFITGYTEADPTVPSWAKQSTKPTYNGGEVKYTGTTGNVVTNNTTLNVAIKAIDDAIGDIETLLASI